MILTERFESAFILANQLHREQRRKNVASPYMGHLLAVASLVCENIEFICSDQDEAESYVMAAILHDAVEDQGGLPTLELIRTKFGDLVADSVWALSDSAPSLGERRAAKSERSATYRKKLSQASLGVVMISCCDKIHNLRSIAYDSLMLGTTAWTAYSLPPSQMIENYRGLGEVFRQRLAGQRLLTIYEEALLGVIACLPEQSAD